MQEFVILSACADSSLLSIQESGSDLPDRFDDAPISRPIQPPAMGPVVEIPQVGGLHHLYTRKAA
jgi:hypothetical protein